MVVGRQAELSDGSLFYDMSCVCGDRTQQRLYSSLDARGGVGSNSPGTRELLARCPLYSCQKEPGAWLAPGHRDAALADQLSRVTLASCDPTDPGTFAGSAWCTGGLHSADRGASLNLLARLKQIAVRTDLVMSSTSPVALADMRPRTVS